MGNVFHLLQTDAAAMEATVYLANLAVVQFVFRQLQPAVQMVLDVYLGHIAVPMEAVA